MVLSTAYYYLFISLYRLPSACYYLLLLNCYTITLTSSFSLPSLLTLLIVTSSLGVPVYRLQCTTTCITVEVLYYSTFRLLVPTRVAGCYSYCRCTVYLQATLTSNLRWSRLSSSSPAHPLGAGVVFVGQLQQIDDQVHHKVRFTMRAVDKCTYIRNKLNGY